MEIKDADDYKDQRLALLMEAVGNDRLEDETCPNCFELYSIPILRKFRVRFLLPQVVKGVEEGIVQEALLGLRGVKEQCVLRRTSSPTELVGEYVCGWCKHSYMGQLDLIASQAETKVLSFFGYDNDRIYERDFYTFSVLDDSYGPFVKELWEDSVFTTFDAHSMENDIEDVITGSVLQQLRAFFKKFANVVYQDIGATVEIYTESHAGKQEAGKGKRQTATGADFAIWVGPLTKEDAQLLSAYGKNPALGKDTLPVRVGNGVIFQAKKANGEVDRHQIQDLVHYASISYGEHDYYGIPGKLFMNYSTAPPYVTVLPCDYTYALYSGDLFKEGQQTINFKRTLKELAQYATQTELPEFVEAYLSGKAGTPLLMLRDVFGVDGPKLIIGLPPEKLLAPTTTGGVLAGVLGGWVSNLTESLAMIKQEEDERVEVAQAEAQASEEWCRRAEQEEHARRQQQQQQQQQQVKVEQKMRYQ